MPDSGTITTAAGLATAVVVVLAPRVYDRLTGRHEQEATVAERLSAGASDVTAAALAVLEHSNAERARAEAAEAECRRALAEANRRITQNARRLDALGESLGVAVPDPPELEADQAPG